LSQPQASPAPLSILVPSSLSQRLSTLSGSGRPALPTVLGIGYWDQGHRVICVQVRKNINDDLPALFKIFRFLVKFFIKDISVKSLQEMKKSMY
jgi:hypothetical protein